MRYKRQYDPEEDPEMTEEQEIEEAAEREEAEANALQASCYPEPEVEDAEEEEEVQMEGVVAEEGAPWGNRDMDRPAKRLKRTVEDKEVDPLRLVSTMVQREYDVWQWVLTTALSWDDWELFDGHNTGDWCKKLAYHKESRTWRVDVKLGCCPLCPTGAWHPTRGAYLVVRQLRGGVETCSYGCYRRATPDEPKEVPEREIGRRPTKPAPRAAAPTVGTAAPKAPGPRPKFFHGTTDWHFHVFIRQAKEDGSLPPAVIDATAIRVAEAKLDALIAAFAASEEGRRFACDAAGWYFYEAKSGVWVRPAGRSSGGLSTSDRVRNAFKVYATSRLGCILKELVEVQDHLDPGQKVELLTYACTVVSSAKDAQTNLCMGGRQGQIESVLKEALFQPAFGSSLDRDANLRCFKNGVLDFATAQFHPHAPTFHCSRQANHDLLPELLASGVEDWDPRDWGALDALDDGLAGNSWVAPLREGFDHLAKVLPDEAARSCYRDFQAYCTTGLATLPWMFVCISGRSTNNNEGKSATQSIHDAFSGSYSTEVPAAALIAPPNGGRCDPNAHTAHLNMLVSGPRVARLSEIPKGATLDGKALKDITDGLLVTRGLRQEYTSSWCYARVFISTNHALQYSGDKATTGSLDKRHCGAFFDAQFCATEEQRSAAERRGVRSAHLIDNTVVKRLCSAPHRAAIGTWYCAVLLRLIAAARARAGAAAAPLAAGELPDVATLIQDTYEDYRSTFLAAYQGRTDWFALFVQQVTFIPNNPERLDADETIFQDAFELMKVTHEYVPRREPDRGRETSWVDVRKRLISHLKDTHDIGNVDGVSKRTPGGTRRLLLIEPTAGSDFAAACDEVRAQRSAPPV
jgi:hypothetical protein